MYHNKNYNALLFFENKDVFNLSKNWMLSKSVIFSVIAFSYWFLSAPNSTAIDLPSTYSDQQYFDTYPCVEKEFPDDWVERIVGHATPYLPTSFTSKDMDNDGFKDIVTGGWWYKNPGHTGEAWLMKTIGGPLNDAVILHDFDNDGDIDVFGSQGKPNGTALAWAENDGNGNFTIHTNIPEGSSTWNESYIAGAAIGNFDGVPNIQIAITWNGAQNSGSYVQMLTVPADPVNNNWSIAPISPDSYGQEIAAGDIDNDGDLDLFQGANWLRNNNGSWTTFSTGVSIAAHAAQNILADIDNDGQLEGIIIREGNHTELVWIKPPADPHQGWTRKTIAPSLDQVLDLEILDLDDDGDLDIITGRGDNSQTLYAYENNLCDNNTWNHITLHYGVMDLHYKILSEDIDNDGDLDILTLGQNNGIVRTFLNAEPNLPIKTYRLNFGGPSFVGPDSSLWQRPHYFRGRGGDGSPYDNDTPIANTDNDVLYQTETYGSKLRFDIPVGPSGPFTVKLHFAEIFHGLENANGIGARIFNVDIENGQGQLLNYDIIKKAGAPATAVVETFNHIEVIDGYLSINLTVVKEKAKISGIEIISEGVIANLPPVIYNPGSLLHTKDDTVNYDIDANDLYGDALTFTQTGLPDFLNIDPVTGNISGILTADEGEYPVTITATDPKGLSDSKNFVFFVIDSSTFSLYNLNTGGAELTYSGKVWQPDQFFDGGFRYSNSVRIDEKAGYNIYNGERYGNTFNYNIPVSDSGLYIVRLHFAEIYHGVKNLKGAGTRIFNVNIENGQGQLQHYDIVEKAGASQRSVIETFNNVQVNDGALTIAFTTEKNNAKISAIEVIKYGEEINNTHLYASTDLSENNVNIYPNPIHDRFKINIKLEQEENVFIYLFDGFGKKTDLGSYDLPKGSTSLDFDISGLSLHRGLFYLVIKSDRRDHPTRKLFIGQ